MPNSRHFNVSYMPFNTIRENKILAKISKFTVMLVHTYCGNILSYNEIESLHDSYPANDYILVHNQNIISVSYVSVAEDTGLSPALSGIPKTNPEDRYCRDEAQIKGYVTLTMLVFSLLVIISHW